MSTVLTENTMKKLIDTDLEAFFKVCIFMPFSFRAIFLLHNIYRFKAEPWIMWELVQGQGFPERQNPSDLHSDSAESE